MVNEKIRQGLGLAGDGRRVNLKRRSAGEAGVDVVPPFQLIAFAQLPAEQDHPAAT